MNQTTIPRSHQPWREPRTLTCPRCSSPFVRVLNTRHAGDERRRYVVCVTCLLRFRTSGPWIPGLHLDRTDWRERARKEKPRRLAQLQAARVEARRQALHLMSSYRWRVFYWAKWWLKKVTNRLKNLLTSSLVAQPQ